MGTGQENLNTIFLIGIAIFGGTVGARIFQKMRIPQVVGYVVIGIILGPILRIISQQTIRDLAPFDVFALGMIGFLVGGELKREIFVKFGKQVPLILLFEGIAAFVLVTVFSFIVMLYFSDWHTALAVAVVFGAICAATDPASTISVLWEYKTRGPLTSMVTAIVTLDDALALALYAISVGIAGVITGHEQTGLGRAFLFALYEMVGSVAVGGGVGFVLSRILRKITDPDKVLAFTTGAALLFIGFAEFVHLDVILTSMAVGVTLVNIESRKTTGTFQLMRRFATPIYILFFVMVGARLQIHTVNLMILLLVVAYVSGSIVGKTGGAYLGALYSRAVKTVRRYLGFCLYPQGGIAIGLLMMASGRFEQQVASTMLLVVIIGAFVLQIIGPIGVKIGAKKAGEVGLNVTEEDLVATYSVSDVMDAGAVVIPAGTSLSEVIRIVGGTVNFYYPVVDVNKRLIGAITLDGIRNTFATQELNDWLVALDIAEPVVDIVTPGVELSEAFEKTRQLDIEYVPVAASEDLDRYVGLLDCRAVRRRIAAEVLARQQKADSMQSSSAV